MLVCSTYKVEQKFKVEQKSPIKTRVVPLFHFEACFLNSQMVNNHLVNMKKLHPIANFSERLCCLHRNANSDSRNARHELLDSRYCHHPSRHPLVGAVGKEFSGIA